MKQLFYSVFFTLFCSLSFAQEITLPTLSKQEMYADFDTLIHTLRDVSPQADVRKAITGVDLETEWGQLRKKIETISTINEFVMLIRQAITFCQDGHTSFLRTDFFDDKKEFLSFGGSEKAYNLLPLYDKIVLTATKNNFDIKLNYLQGEYYNIVPFTYKKQVYPSGLKLLSCNGVPVHEYVQKLVGLKSSMRWDFSNKRYYSTTFYKHSELSITDSLQLTFQDKKKNLFTATYSINEPLQFTKTIDTQQDTTKKVEYIAKHKLLYIRVPSMNTKHIKYYTDGILTHSKNKKIEKVVIDVRDNGGGSDYVWTAILKQLLHKSISYEDLMLCNDNPRIRKLFEKDSTIQWKKYVPSFLPTSSYAVYYESAVNEVKPDSSSIGFEGRIYVLQNENIYSSTGALTAIAALSDQIVNIGLPTNRLLGKGISPFIFELPISKIVYRVEPVIDFMNTKTAEDIFHDKVELPISYSIDEYLDYLTYKGKHYTTDYLLKKDKLFKEVLKQPKAN